MKAEPPRLEATKAAEGMRRRARKAGRLTANVRKVELMMDVPMMAGRKKEEAKKVGPMRDVATRVDLKRGARLKDVPRKADRMKDAPKRADRQRVVPRRADRMKDVPKRASLRLLILPVPDRAKADQAAKVAATRAERATRTINRLAR